MIKNVKPVEIYTKYVTAFLNTRDLKMQMSIRYVYTNVHTVIKITKKSLMKN